MIKLELNPHSNKNREDNNAEEVVDMIKAWIQKKFSICFSVVVCLRMDVTIDKEAKDKVRNIKVDKANNELKGNKDKDSKVTKIH
jgi:hypothetical protein|tara:strand:+ start:272 stop:526 length:255 start_codon:yes stop_codon:yes gene_type:complete